MDEKLRLKVDQFGIQAGNWRHNPANISVPDAAAMPRSWRGRGSLYILVEVPQNAPLPQGLLEELITALNETYYSVSGSVTRGLRAALLAANDLLFERNLRADSDHRVVLGLNCALVRERDVYIGQVGPALATLVREGGLLRYPSDSAWLRSESPGTFDLNREPPAGLRREVEPSLSHVSLSPGDVLILSTTALARMGAPEELVNAVTYTGDESARGNLEALAGGRDLSAVVIECYGDRRAGGRGQEGPAERAALPEERPATPEVAEEATVRDQVAQPEALPQVSTPSVTDAMATPAEGEGEGLEGKLEGDVAQEAPAREPEGTDTARRGLRDALGQRTDRIRRGAGDLLDRVLPESLPERPLARQAPGRSLSLSGRALVAVSVAIPLVMMFLVIMARVQYERTLRLQFVNLKSDALSEYEKAMGSADRGVQREGLRRALDIVEDGLAIKPGDEELTSLQRRVNHQLDEIDIVQRLYHFWQLAELQEEEAAAPTDSSRIVVEGSNVFLLHRGSDRVYKFLLNDVGDALQPVNSSPVLMQKGELRGGIRLGDMVDIAWMESGGQRTLSTFVTLERNGTLLAYDPQQGIDVLPVANADTWLKPQAIGGYQGNLYVLDPLLNRILKYIPTDNAYTNPPTDYLSPQLDVNLTGAVDMAVDGNLYVLFADGQIRKYLKGEPQPFSMGGLPTPMRSPTTIFVSGAKRPDADGYVYVTDTGNDRILQFDKAGNYLRQFRANPGETQLQRLRGVYVDEARGRMYVLSGKALWLCDVPRLGQKESSSAQ
jgi:hypothetical protein